MKNRLCSLLLVMVIAGIFSACAEKKDVVEAPPLAIEKPALPIKKEPISKEAYVEKTLAQMTIEEKVGQMFLTTSAPNSEYAEDLFSILGGYYFSGERSVPETKIPMFVAIDEEKASFAPENYDNLFFSPQQAFAEGGLDQIGKKTKEQITTFKSLGINMSFSPVYNVVNDLDNSLRSLTFGGDYENTAIYTSIVVSSLKENKMGSITKYYPSHKIIKNTINLDRRSLETLHETDFIPLKAAINMGVDGVLISNTIMEGVDTTLPASLSVAAHLYLKNDLAFNGAFVADLTTLGNVQPLTHIDPIILAILAGNDIIIVDDYNLAINTIKEAIKKGEIGEERLDESVAKILNLKLALNIIELP